MWVHLLLLHRNTFQRSCISMHFKPELVPPWFHGCWGLLLGCSCSSPLALTQALQQPRSFIIIHAITKMPKGIINYLMLITKLCRAKPRPTMCVQSIYCKRSSPLSRVFQALQGMYWMWCYLSTMRARICSALAPSHAVAVELWAKNNKLWWERGWIILGWTTQKLCHTAFKLALACVSHRG